MKGLGFAGKRRCGRYRELFFSLDTNFGPTLGQRQYFDEIQPAYRTRVEEVNKFLRETLPQWNENLRGVECADADDAETVVKNKDGPQITRMVQI